MAKFCGGAQNLKLRHCLSRCLTVGLRLWQAIEAKPFISVLLSSMPSLLVVTDLFNFQTDCKSDLFQNIAHIHFADHLSSAH